MIRVKIKYSVLICVLVLIHSCGGGRSLQEATTPQPDWVRSRPVSPGYYTGIGWAQKTVNINQYQQAAKQNALADLASEISVNISTNSVLHAFESKLGYREDFSSTVQASSQEELEGFEMAGIWEDQANYWVYYRLSVNRHREIKEKRKNDATARALGLLENAMVSREQGNMRMNIVQLINSMEAVRNYLDEPLPVEFGGRNIQLGDEIFNELYATISRLQITPLQREIEIKTGQEIPPSMLKFRVTCNSGGAVGGFPLLANYSERPLRNNRIRTDNDGIAGFGIDRIRSSGSHETFTVMADMENILSEANTDPVIRRLIRRFPVPEGTARINILKPVIMIAATEEAGGKAFPKGTLGDSFRRNAAEAGYELTEKSEEADFIVAINANAVPAGEAGTYKNVILQGSIMVHLADGNLIYQRDLDGFRGSHFDFDRAGEDAYRQAVRRMNSSYFREIDEVIKSGVQR